MTMPEGTKQTPFELPEEGDAFPEHLVALLWYRIESARDFEFYGRPRSREQLQMLIGHAFQASLQSEEGRPVRFQLLFELFPKQVTISFSAHIVYNAQQLVRLAPTIGLGFRWLVVAPPDPAEDAVGIVGVCDPQLSPPERVPLNRWGNGLAFHMSSVVGLKISVLGPGNLLVTTGGGWSCQLQHGAIRLPMVPGRIARVREWFEEAGDRLDNKDRLLARELVRRTWTSILKKVSDARHGGGFLIVPDNFGEGGSHLKIKHRLNSSRFRDALMARLGVEPQLSCHVSGKQDIDVMALEDAPFLERGVVRTADFVASLAAVDGAVVICRNLDIVGFGAEIVQVRVPGEGETVDFGRHPSLQGQEPDIRPLSSFGMRHRSAIRFCQEVPGSMAFVVSQDGGVRVFFSSKGQPQCRDVIPEDWIVS